jgi:hypothetical protein
MSETPEVQWDEDIPPERPEPGGGESAVEDEPLGVPADGETDVEPLPGMPESEPPSSG